MYVTSEEPNRSPHIMSIEKIWTQKDGLQVCCHYSYRGMPLLLLGIFLWPMLNNATIEIPALFIYGTYYKITFCVLCCSGLSSVSFIITIS